MEPIAAIKISARSQELSCGSGISIYPPSQDAFNVVWMLLSAVLFLAGSAHASLAGAALLAKLGILGAIAAIAFLAAFS